MVAPVLRAAQHFHQTGLIPRDIKPTNVLVAEYDDDAVPKMFDFGVANATALNLAEKSMFTELGQTVGTVEYMIPRTGIAPYSDGSGEEKR